MSSMKSRAQLAGILYVLTGLTGAFNLLYIRSAFMVPGMQPRQPAVSLMRH
jgi:uncharacterized membrane protein YuzA (DUF378 family)